MLPNPAQWYANLRLRILPLRIVIRWSRPAAIPAHILPNVLRGAFNITFRRLVCPPDWFNNACSPCPLYAQCPYGQLFEPSPPPDSDRLRLLSDLPRPFVLKPPLAAFDEPAADPASQGNLPAPAPLAPRPIPLATAAFQPSGPLRRSSQRADLLPPRAASPSDPRALRLEFGFTLFGVAIDHLAHFIVTLAELGRTGMGRDRIPFTIESVTTPAPPGHPPDAPAQSLYDPATHTFTPPQRVLSAENLAADASPSADSRTPSGSSRLTLRFLTPTLIRSGSGVDTAGRRIPAKEVRDRPEFGVVLRRLRDRLSALSTFFGEAPWSGPDFAEMGRLADQAQLVQSETRWLSRTRRSTRTQETHEISGLIGTATYEFPNPELKALFTPLLKIAPHTHLGKHAVWGNGWVEVQNE